MDKWLKRKATSVDANDLAEAGSSKKTEMDPKSEPAFKKKRKYNESYLQYGFTFTAGTHDEQLPLCLLCNDTLAAESMKPSKLLRHFNIKHAAYSTKPVEYFQNLLKVSNQSKCLLENYAFTQEKYLLASYQASYLIAKAKKPYTVGEELVLPTAVQITETIHGKKYADELRKIPLSNDTVARRISDISCDQFQQLIQRIKESPKFAIQLDESTDITNLAQLLVYVRYSHAFNIHEDLLFCRPMKSYTTGEDIFLQVNEFFKEEGLDWNNCIGVCSDGAAAMKGHRAGFLAKVKSITNGHIMFTHCIIHREALVAKKLSPDLNVVLNDAIRIINFIKCRALNSRLFANLCKDMGADYEQLLLHTEVRWLSKGRALKRLIGLKDEVMIFLSETKSDFLNLFHNEIWVCKLCYLSDIFEKLNELNMSLQGENTNILILYDKIHAFIKKINLLKSSVKNDIFVMFSSTYDFITENNLDNILIKKSIIDHLSSMEEQFKKYFLSDLNTEQFIWIQQPFLVEMAQVKHLTLSAQEEFAEFSCDTNLKIEFSKQTLNCFWLRLKTKYPILAELAMDILLPFATTYLCEMAFSVMTNIKTKQRSRLSNIEIAMRPALTDIKPNFNLLCQNKQAHQSH